MPSADDHQEMARATRLTTDSIRNLLAQQDDTTDPAVSMLSVAERNELIDEIAQVIPAGNVVNFVFSGLLSARKGDKTATGRSHVNALFKGLSLMRNNMLYHMAFTGPATVLAGYNMLLELAGNDPADYLPEGAWQFYVEFGLREDAAHHQTETVGFQRVWGKVAGGNDPVLQLAAWVMACAAMLRDYHRLLELRWAESVRLRVIEETTGLTGLYQEWQRIQPFAAPDVKTGLVVAREAVFDQFCDYYLSQVSKPQWEAFAGVWYDPENQEARGRRQRAYVRQMSIHRQLEPGEYGDERYPLEADELQIGIIYRGAYYLLAVPALGSVEAVRRLIGQVRGILEGGRVLGAGATEILTTAPRSAQLRLRATLDKQQRHDLERLRKAPILINWDERPADVPLPVIRQGQRGIGDHGLTIFRTGESTVFDFSHIFFDGPWSLAVAEMLTNEASKYLHIVCGMAGPQPEATPTAPLRLAASDRLRATAARYEVARPGVSAETRREIEPIQRLRTTLKARTGLRLTVNDLLVLYRTIFNAGYTPGNAVRDRFVALAGHPGGAELVKDLEGMFRAQREQNPSLLIPIDATRYDPKERVFPSTFRSPLPDFRGEHEKLVALRELARQPKANGAPDREVIRAFLDEREAYLGYLQAFGALMERYREIATRGESMGTTAIRLIAGLPKAMQQVMDSIPGQLTVVNEAIKGEEVFSNVGRVVTGSSVRRFSSAKDDNDKKILVWGIMTDDRDQMVITVRDFREPVLALVEAGHVALARLVVTDYLQAYMDGLYQFVAEIEVIVTTSVRRGP